MKKIIGSAFVHGKTPKKRSRANAGEWTQTKDECEKMKILTMMAQVKRTMVGSGRSCRVRTDMNASTMRARHRGTCFADCNFHLNNRARRQDYSIPRVALKGRYISVEKGRSRRKRRRGKVSVLARIVVFQRQAVSERKGTLHDRNIEATAPLSRQRR